MNSYCLVAKVFPVLGTAVFFEYSSAAVVFWVNEEIVLDESGARTFIVDHLTSEGWCIEKEVSFRLVNQDSYPDEAAGRELFEQSLIDGHTAEFHVREREYIGSAESGAQLLHDYPILLKQMSESGAYIMHDEALTTPDGDSYLPVWAEAPTDYWVRRWPDSRATHLPAAGVLRLLESMSIRDIYGGLARRDVILTFNARGVASDLIAGQ